MRISAKAITTYNNVNSFKYGNQWAIRAKEENTLYFQIVDLDQDSIRYMVAAGGTIEVTFPSLDDDDVITVSATQADPADASIWKIDLTDEQSPMSGNVSFAVTESPKTRRFSALAFVSVEYPAAPGECC